MNARSAMRAAMFCVCLVFALPVTGRAACPPQPRAVPLMERWGSKVQIADLPAELSMEEARCLREALVTGLEPRLGRVVGYKAALTSSAMQSRFGVTEPLMGVLLSGMLTLESALPVYTDYGARPIAEADLIVEVGSDAINDARSPSEAARHLSAIHPFIELADLVVAEGRPITGPIIVGINAGARAGVYGRGIPFTPDMAERLKAMRVVTTDDTGAVIADTPGSAILGDPMNAVLWLIEHLRQTGIRLKTGDLLSLGAYSPPVLPRAGRRLFVRYVGLPGDPVIAIRFRDP